MEAASSSSFSVGLIPAIPTVVVFDFTYTGTGNADSASGTLDAVSNGDGSFTVISGSGLFDTFSITLIANPTPPGPVSSPTGFFQYDDQLFPAMDPLVSNGGLLFSISTGTAIELNIYSNGPGSYTAYLNDGTNRNGIFSLGQVVVPEPTTLPLVLGGSVALVLCYRLRRRSAR